MNVEKIYLPFIDTDIAYTDYLAINVRDVLDNRVKPCLQLFE